MHDAWFGSLVRVVAKDGSVWWVKPSSAPAYAALDRAKSKGDKWVMPDWWPAHLRGAK